MSEKIGPGPFEKPKRPWKLKTLYSKTWRAPYTHGLTDQWRQQCREYWERVERRFGVVFSDHRSAWSGDYGGCVTTYATVLVILPGERVEVPEGERLASASAAMVH